ncbi:MAG: putative nucleotide-diphospho-sugar transferase [Pseudomonadota bacterium]
MTNPDLPIDLFTDGETDDPVFARVVPLERVWFRPKFEAMRRSRFDRTLYLDTDLRVLADISDVFDLLDRVEIAGAHDAYRASRKALDPSLPPAFPQINSGVLALRSGDRTAGIMAEVERQLHESQAKKDQPILRRVLWESDIAVGILPEEYNLMAYRHVALWSDRYAAPRIVHNSRFSHLGAGGLAALTGGRLARHIEQLIRHDPTLQTDATRSRIFPPIDRTPWGAVARAVEKIRLEAAKRRAKD